jgi:hypothetical protein
MVKLGLRGKTYRNVGSYAVPVWNLIDNIKDLVLTLAKGKADVSRRATGGWKAQIGTLKEATIGWSSVWDTEDDDFLTFRNSYLDGDSVDLMVLDGESNVAGSQGFRADVECFTFTRNEQLTEAMSLDIECEPTYSANAPYWVTV